MANDIDKDLIGNVINALPIEQMIASPLSAMVSAQVNAAKSYMEFITGVCIKDGKAVAVDFSYDETIVDESGRAVLDKNNKPQVITKHLSVPLMTMVSHPSIAIEKGTIDFELEVSQACSQNSTTEAGGSIKAGINWGVVSATLKGKVSHKSEQTRKTDTRAKYSIHTEVTRQEPAEGMMRVMELLNDSQIKGVVGKISEDPKKPDPKKPDPKKPEGDKQ